MTGAGMGIGQGIAVELARQGAEVVVHYAHTEPEETVSRIEELGGKAATVQGDLSKVGECERTVDAAAEALGGLDTLVNNAGVTQALDFLDTDEETYDSVFDLNMKGYSKEGALILDLIQRLKEERGIPMILIVHNYAQVFDVCDRVNLLRNGRIESTTNRSPRAPWRS